MLTLHLSPMTGVTQSSSFLRMMLLTNSTWTEERFRPRFTDGNGSDLQAEGLELVKKVTVIPAYNKDDQQNGIEAYNRFVATAPQTLRNDVIVQSLRWNLSELVEQTIGHVLGPSLRRSASWVN